MVTKLCNENGEVAVLVSPKYGAGWSTWNEGCCAEYLLFDAGLVKLAQNKVSVELVEKYINEVLSLEGVYCGGWYNIEVVWLPKGTEFIVNEYDGYETIEFKSNVGWRVA